MAKELSRIKTETQREEKMRQYIRENRYSVTVAMVTVTIQNLAFLLCFSCDRPQPGAS